MEVRGMSLSLSRYPNLCLQTCNTYTYIYNLIKIATYYHIHQYSFNIYTLTINSTTIKTITMQNKKKCRTTSLEICFHCCFKQEKRTNNNNKFHHISSMHLTQNY